MKFRKDEKIKTWLKDKKEIAGSISPPSPKPPKKYSSKGVLGRPAFKSPPPHPLNIHYDLNFEYFRPEVNNYWHLWVSENWAERCG